MATEVEMKFELNENIPEIKLKYTKLDNGGFVISIDNTVDTMIELGDSLDNRVQGLLLYNNNTNYVLGFTKLSNPVVVQNRIRIPYTGVLCGANVCSRFVNTPQETIDYNELLNENKILKALLNELDDYI